MSLFTIWFSEIHMNGKRNIPLGIDPKPSVIIPFIYKPVK
jgi:hypothetical protein